MSRSINRNNFFFQTKGNKPCFIEHLKRNNDREVIACMTNTKDALFSEGDKCTKAAHILSQDLKEVIAYTTNIIDALLSEGAKHRQDAHMLSQDLEEFQRKSDSASLPSPSLVSHSPSGLNQNPEDVWTRRVVRRENTSRRREASKKSMRMSTRTGTRT